MEVKIEMTDDDFDRLTTNSTHWASAWAQSWEDQVLDDERFEFVTVTPTGVSISHWAMAYWAGDNWLSVVLMRSYLTAAGHNCEVLFDLGEPSEYVILTDYVTRSWRDIEEAMREAEGRAGVSRGDLVKGDDFSGLGKVISVVLKGAQPEVAVKIPNGAPPVQFFPAERVRWVATPKAEEIMS